MTQIALIADEVSSPPSMEGNTEGEETSLRRACLGSYRGRRSVLTEIAETLSVCSFSSDWGV